MKIISNNLVQYFADRKLHNLINVPPGSSSFSAKLHHCGNVFLASKFGALNKQWKMNFIQLWETKLLFLFFLLFDGFNFLLKKFNIKTSDLIYDHDLRKKTIFKNHHSQQRKICFDCCCCCWIYLQNRENNKFQSKLIKWSITVKWAMSWRSN
jgi:hypothetical protein